MSLQGLDPDRVAGITPLIAECRPLLSAADMDAVQELLSARGVGVMDSIIITRELLGAGPTALGDAKGIVLALHEVSSDRRIRTWWRGCSAHLIRSLKRDVSHRRCLRACAGSRRPGNPCRLVRHSASRSWD